MPKDESWIDGRLQQCAKTHASVTEAAVARLKGLLEGEAHERPLAQGELLATAAQLIEDMMTPVKRKGKSKPNRDYYFEYHLWCPKCEIAYQVESAKRFVERSPSLFGD